MTHFARLACLAALGVCASAVAQPDEATPLVFKSATVTFGSRFAFALDDGGRIWTRALEAPGPWVLLGPTGLPQGEETPPPGTRLVELYADSTGLIAVGADGRVYDAEIEDAVQGRVLWNFRWGNPWRIGAVPLFLPKRAVRQKVYSLLNHEAYFQEDIDGNPHITLRVDTFWLLSEDGRSLHYDDPWLPPNDFLLGIASPDLGRVELTAVAASASTLFACDAAGNLYTRLIDFDTQGGNPGITYSWLRRNYGHAPEGFWAELRAKLPFLLDVRSLPAEDWRPQPRVPGVATSRLAIVQTGKGNAARELRVEGADAQGHTGYWRKPVLGGTWEFVETGLALEGAAFAAAEPPVHPPLAEVLEGEAKFDLPGMPRQTRPVQVQGFNALFERARLTVAAGKDAQLRFDLYQRPDPFPPRPGEKKRWMGALVLDDASLDSFEAGEAFQTLFGGMRANEVYVLVSEDHVRIEPIPNARADGVFFRMELDRP